MKAWLIACAVLVVSIPLVHYYGARDIMVRVRTLETSDAGALVEIGWLCHAAGDKLEECKRKLDNAVTGLKPEYCVGKCGDHWCGANDHKCGD